LIAAERDRRVGALLDQATKRLADAGVPDPRLEAQLLLSWLLGTDRGGLLVRRNERLDDEPLGRYAEWISRRERREPAQHILGSQEFYGRSFHVDRRVLVPRPESETLIDTVLALELPSRARVADLGTGSGCLALTLAAERPQDEIWALDRSADALAVARANAELHGLQARVRWVQADLADPPRAWSGTMNVVVCNPPYVSEAEWVGLQPEVRDHDPREALVPGPSGLEAYAVLAPVALRLAEPGGYLVVELGYGQEDSVRSLVEQAGFRGVRTLADLRGVTRVLVGRRPALEDGQ